MKKLMLYIMAVCLLIISCQSARIEYKYIVPEIDYPTFPAIEREVHSDGSWTISKEYVDLLAEYYTRIVESEKNYKEIKELYEKEQKK